MNIEVGKTFIIFIRHSNSLVDNQYIYFNNQCDQNIINYYV